MPPTEVAQGATDGVLDPVVQDFRGAIGSVQGAQVLYAPASAGGSVTPEFSKQNMLSVVGRNPSFTAGIEEAARKGAIIAPYLNAVLSSPTGPYQALMHNDSECGPALGTWSGTGTQYGIGARVDAGHFGDKLVCVVRRIKADYPFIKAIFLDDFGPGWSGYDKNGTSPDAPQSEECIARNALGAAYDKLRRANLGLLYIVNGGWSPNFCGGWPEAGQQGLYFAIPTYEHHPIAHGPSADTSYGPQSQWLRDRRGNAGVFVITNTREETDYYKAKPWAAWVAQQTTDEYTNYTATTVRPVVGSSHSIGLSFGEPVGNTQVGTAWSAGQSADLLRVTPVTLPTAAAVNSLSVHLDGRAGVQAGTQNVRLAIYSELNGRPHQLLGVGKPFAVAAQSLGAWYTSELPSPVNLVAGRYWLGIWTGATAAVSRNNGAFGPAGSVNYYAMNAPYSATAAPPRCLWRVVRATTCRRCS